MKSFRKQNERVQTVGQQYEIDEHTKRQVHYVRSTKRHHQSIIEIIACHWHNLSFRSALLKLTVWAIFWCLKKITNFPQKRVASAIFALQYMDLGSVKINKVQFHEEWPDFIGILLNLLHRKTGSRQCLTRGLHSVQKRIEAIHLYLLIFAQLNRYPLHSTVFSSQFIPFALLTNGKFLSFAG